ncbi:hypothetical protein ILYODFUR_012668 [Ilyodon furcidens]|uniref:Uncharacterized protein n=1 Tax=Ilyodon furcidens TaxID=33524 RepID=A0ABV0UHE2_9TELE
MTESTTVILSELQHSSMQTGEPSRSTTISAAFHQSGMHGGGGADESHSFIKGTKANHQPSTTVLDSWNRVFMLICCLVFAKYFWFGSICSTCLPILIQLCCRFSSFLVVQS